MFGENGVSPEGAEQLGETLEGSCAYFGAWDDPGAQTQGYARSSLPPGLACFGPLALLPGLMTDPRDVGNAFGETPHSTTLPRGMGALSRCISLVCGKSSSVENVY